MTFSRSLAEHIARTSEAPLHVVRVRLRLGALLAPGAVSPTGLYAVCSARSGRILRVTLFQDLAELWRDPSRTVYACFLRVDNP